MALPEHEQDRQILQAIAASDRVTQRSLSGELGVALGLTNLLIRRVVNKGYVRVARMGTRHVRYLMTPAGWEAEVTFSTPGTDPQRLTIRQDSLLRSAK